MPERILRDVTDSDRYNAVSVYARDTFIRILNKADDYGCLVGDARRLRVLLYPLTVDDVSEASVGGWLGELEAADLIRRYTSDGKLYLQVNRWRQRLRSKNRKFPVPPWEKNEPQPTDTGTPIRTENPPPACESTPYVGRPRTETETEAQSETEDPQTPASGGGGRPRRSEKPKAEDVPIPPALDVPKFRDAWAKYLRHRREKPGGKLTPTAAEERLRECEAIGVDRAVKAIDHSVANGWTGIFEPDTGRGSNHDAKKPPKIDAGIAKGPGGLPPATIVRGNPLGRPGGGGSGGQVPHANTRPGGPAAPAVPAATSPAFRH